MTNTKADIRQEIEAILIENGPLPFTEIKKYLDYEPNNVLHCLYHEPRFVMDDSWRFHLANVDS